MALGGRDLDPGMILIENNVIHMLRSHLFGSGLSLLRGLLSLNARGGDASHTLRSDRNRL